MPQPRSAALKRAHQEITAIHQAISGMQYLSSGTLLKRTKVCGNPQCHCARDKAARHGPYYEWSYLKAGRLHHRSFTPAQAELMRRAIANYRKAKKLLRVWEAHTQRLIELSDPE